MKPLKILIARRRSLSVFRVAVGIVVATLAAGLTVFATSAASGEAAPKLVANTPAPCNEPQPEGYAHCLAIVRTPSDHVITPDASGPPSTALGPADIQSAYKLPSASAGGGQTVAIVDAGDDPTAESDLAVFRSQYGLPPCTTANACFKKVNQQGQQGSYPPVNGTWPVEESLDLDAVSSACPNCNILLVEATSSLIDDLGTSVDEAVALGASAVSNSYGATPEPATETSFDQYYDHPGVAVTASAGDSGWQVNYPSASPYVTAVGGTMLTKDTSVARGWDESAWGNGAQGASGDGTGSGCSAVEPQPTFQQGIAQLEAACGNRATADVSADAAPASGLAVYDTTGQSGWLQVGGTSLASPLIAATFALAGTPTTNTRPNEYPYHDANQSSDLFDVTQGSNGNCGNVLCNAGTGWDGPTGLGTPDGVQAFQGAPQGQINGQVTDASTRKPVAGATITAQPGDYVTRTDASGNYNLTLASGTYTLTTTDYGYAPGTQSGVQVTAGQTLTENFALTAQPTGTLSGTVTDGSGHGWPLHARISVPGDPDSPIWTNPYTGAYSITVPQGNYTLTMSTDYPGYQDKTVQVTVGGATTQNLSLDADLTACTAPGYGPDGLTENFAGWTGASAQDGWTTTGGPGWRFDDPGNRVPPPSAARSPYPGLDKSHFSTYDSDTFATADAGYYAPRSLHTTLTSPTLNLSGQDAPKIMFDSAYYPAGDTDTAQVQLSTNGGQTWNTVWHQGSQNALGPISVPIPQASGKSQVKARWVFTGAGLGYWALGGVLVGTDTCTPQAGGMVAGMVTASSDGSTVNGASVASAASPPPYPWPQGIALATSDPALPGGFYWLFAPAGSQQLSATATGYATATATVNAAKDQVTRKDWTLSPAPGG